MADKHDLVDLSVHEVSLVDSPANKGARVLLFKRGEAFERDDTFEGDVEAYLKREFSDDKRQQLADSGAALPDGSYPIEDVGDLKNAIRAFGRAKDKAKTKAHIIARARALGQSDLIPDDWKESADKRDLLKRALAALGIKIGKDAKDGDPPKSFDDLITAQALQPRMWDAWNALQCSVTSILEHAPEGEKEPLLQASLDEFKTYIQDLVAGAVKKTTGAPAGDDPMATAALKKSLGLPETATDAEVEKAVADQAAALAKAQSEAAIAKMSDKHKAYADAKGMKGDALANFAAKTADERDAHMDAHPLEKRGGEDGVDALQKRFDAELKKRDDQIAELTKANEIGAIRKRMEALPFAGDVEENTQTIYSLGKTDKAAADRFEKSLEAMNERLAKSELFSERGSALKGAGTAAAAIEKAAEELRKSNGDWSMAKARTEARRQNPELAAKEKSEQREAQASARR